MDEKLTRKSQEAFSAAARRATTDGNPHVDPAHLLVTLVEQPGGTAAPLLRSIGADPAEVRRQAEEMLARLPRAAGQTVSVPGLSRQLAAVLNTAGQRARELKDEYVSTEHLLVGLAADGGDVAALLRRAGAGPDELLGAFQKVRGSARVTSEDPEGTYKALEKYGVDLTEAPATASSTRLSAGTPRSAGYPGAFPPDQEQPGAHWRAWGRQDRRRRGPGTADRGRRRSRVAAREAAGRA